MGEEVIGKRLYRFFISKNLLENVSIYISWVLLSNIYDHSPISLQFEQQPSEVNYPFKFNQTWIKDVSFCQMVREFWPSSSIPEGLNEMDSPVLKINKLKVKVVY